MTLRTNARKCDRMIVKMYMYLYVYTHPVIANEAPMYIEAVMDHGAWTR